MQNSRRSFIKNSVLATSAFVIAMHVPSKLKASDEVKNTNIKELDLNAFVEIKSDNTINFYIGQVEMGQNTYTTLAMCIAEELDVKWDDINIKPAPIAPAHNHIWAPMIFTGGSSSIIAKQSEFRKVGAALNIMLKLAAAKKWKVRKFNIETKESVIINKITKESFTYGELVSDLNSMKVPHNPKIKPLNKCNIIGKPTKRHPKEAWAKIKGEAIYGIDIKVDSMKYAAILHPTIFGATIESYDARKAEKRKGIIKIKEIPTGIVVIAEHWWMAKEALNDIDVVWNKGPNAFLSTESLHEEYAELMEKDGAIMRKDGDTQKAFQESTKIIETEFNFPFLAHAAMEPLNCVVHDKNGSATIWSSTQMQTVTRKAVAEVLGYKPERVDYETPYLGGGFGRRFPNNLDYIMDATYAAKGEDWPVQTLWTREDDIKMGNYRPMYKNKARIALNERGEISAFEAKVSSQSIFKDTVFGAWFKDGIDWAQKEGLENHPYNIESHDLQAYTAKTVLPVLWWRSVGHTQTGPFVEILIDMAANESGTDPLEYRKNMLKDTRHIKLLEDVAKLSNWAKRKKEKNVGYGVSFVPSFGSIVAQIAKVRVIKNEYKIENVWCSVDCGFAFNPLNVENQMISGINFAIAATKYSEITLKNGETQQSNFHDYQVTRISDVPDIKVSIINSGEQIGGIGEPGTPPLFGAVSNAIFDAIGERHTDFPIKLG